MDRFDAIPFSDLSSEKSWTRLGKGSFGCVYKGEYLGLEVAIKEVLSSSEYDVDKYFQRECNILQESRHPNIVQYLGLCLAPASDSSVNRSIDIGLPARPRILIISEYLPKGNLRAYIRNRSLPFPWRLRLSFAIDTTRAVAYLHARQCLHRDLKGENLLVTDNDRVKVCDFGFARIAAQNEEEMRRMSYCGTDGYMSPEILAGKEFGLSTDIFSLGMIIIEILSRTVVDQYNFVRGPPDFSISPDEVSAAASPHCPPALLDLALACVQVTPSARPSVLDILKILREIEAEATEMESCGLDMICGLRKGAGHSNSWNIGSSSFAGSIQTESNDVDYISERSASLTESRSSGESSSEHDVTILACALVDVEGGSSNDKIGGKSIVLHDEASMQDEGRLSLTGSSDLGDSTTSSGSKLFPSLLQESNFTLKAFPMPEPNIREDFEGFDALSSRTGDLPALPDSWLQDCTVVQTLSVDENNSAGESFHAAEAGEVNVYLSSILASSKLLSQLASSEHMTTRPHRFSLVKLSFQRFMNAIGGSPLVPSLFSSPTSSRAQPLDPAPEVVNYIPQSDKVSSQKDVLFLSSPGDVKPSKATLDTALKRSSTEEPSLRTLWAVTGGECNMCEKRIGIVTAYMVCDDCGFRYEPEILPHGKFIADVENDPLLYLNQSCHNKCSDDCPPHCGLSIKAMKEFLAAKKTVIASKQSKIEEQFK